MPEEQNNNLSVKDEILKDLENLSSGDLPRISKITKEFIESFSFIKKYPKSVTILGSARFTEDNIHYDQAKKIAKKIVEELNYAIVTGGGLGIMEAGNRGAHEASGDSIGFLIKLPREQEKNAYLTDSVEFHYFFSRKVAMVFSAEAYLVFPGGFGTLNELFEILTLVQTKKIPRVPIVLVGTDFWEPIDDYIRKNLYEKHKAISKGDMDIYTITDDVDEVIKIIKNAPIREE